jgi:hypothetical protein
VEVAVYKPGKTIDEITTVGKFILTERGIECDPPDQPLLLRLLEEPVYLYGKGWVTAEGSPRTWLDNVWTIARSPYLWTGPPQKEELTPHEEANARPGG